MNVKHRRLAAKNIASCHANPHGRNTLLLVSDCTQKIGPRHPGFSRWFPPEGFARCLRQSTPGVAKTVSIRPSLATQLQPQPDCIGNTAR